MKQARYYPIIGRLTYWYEDDKICTVYCKSQFAAEEIIRDVALVREVVQVLEIIPRDKI